MMQKLISVTLVITLLIFAASLCLAESVLNIVCTSFPCYDFVRAVAADRANIQLLIKPGSEVHSYDPTPADVMAIAGCDLFVYIGGESDAWVVDILDSFGKSAPQTLRFFDCVERMEAEHDHAHAEDEHAYDEHIWTSQTNASAMVNALSNVLQEMDSEHADFYARRAQDYNLEISQLNAEIEAIVEHAARKEMIFADRFPFAYFANEYGLAWRAAFPSCASESEPSAKTIAELIDKVKTDDVPVIYTLELSNGKTAKTIAEETGAKVLTFHSVQNVTEADFAAGETYITLMKRNVEALREGLN